VGTGGGIGGVPSILGGSIRESVKLGWRDDAKREIVFGGGGVGRRHRALLGGLKGERYDLLHAGINERNREA